MVCSFTGHRPGKLPFRMKDDDARYLKLKAVLKENIKQKIESGTNAFLSGMALGVDMLAAECVLEFKALDPSIKIGAVIPCRDQTRLWKREDVERYNAILSRCDVSVMISEYYTNSCMFERNRYLVEKAQSLIAVWDGTNGGTSYTVSLARKKGIPITVINPYRL